ncbi:helix-hairpin-helix domain-containing protein, partial [Nanoarchaeota archaeon]
MKNLEIAKIFYEIADILELQNVQWKPNAYRKAARSIEKMSDDVVDLYKEGGLKSIEKIPGVGEGIGKKIIEFIETGKIKSYIKLKKSTKIDVEGLMNVGSLGPRKVKILAKRLGVKNIKDLEKAVKKHKIAGLSGFGEKSEENIMKGIELRSKSTRRMLLGKALP